MSLWDSLLDRTVAFSFDRTGFARHQRRFVAGDTRDDLGGAHILITGANSGLGLAAALALRQRGAGLTLLCRDPVKAAAARAALEAVGSGPLTFLPVDMADVDSVSAAAARVEGPIDALVHNAGLLPLKREQSAQGQELTVAVHLSGPLRLTAALRPQLAQSPRGGRVIFVSSGGMYSERLRVDGLSYPEEPYDGVKAYARSKRAQVVLGELLHARLAGQGIEVASMHPGWADTPGVASSIPTFRALTAKILRSPAEGADTIVWLAATPRLRGQFGGFWFDRAPAETHLMPFTREEAPERERLWSTVHTLAGLDPDSAWG